MPIAAFDARGRDGQKGGFAENVAGAVVEETAALIGSTAAGGDFAALEAAARVVETRCNGDRSDERSWWACACGARARRAGRRAKRFVTVLGPVTLKRAYYCCPRCHAGFCPRDRALGLDAGSLSPGVRRMVGSAAAEASFAATGGLLHDLAGVAVDAKQAERAAEALGGEIADDEAHPTE